MKGEEIFKQFREHSVAEFFKKNRQMLGFSGKVRSLTMIVHEFTTNSVSWDTPTVVKIGGKIQIRKIGELVDSIMKKFEIESSLDGELESTRRFDKFKVLCFDKNELKLNFKDVKSVHRHHIKKNEKLINIKLLGGRNVEITKHHSVFTLTNGNIVPLKGEEIQVGDYLVVPRKKWSGFEDNQEMNILEEALKLSNEKLKEFSLFGVKEILYQNKDVLKKIKAPLSSWEKNHDFYSNYMKCDRLPVRLLKVLNEEERKFFYGCKIGYRQIRHGKINCTMRITPDLMQLLGLYVAEGNTRDNLMGISFSFGSHEKELVEITRNLIKKIFGVEALVGAAHKTAVNVTAGSKTAAFLISEIFKCGKKAKRKKIPEIIFNTKPETAIEFLYGYLAGDGYPSKEFTNYLNNKEFSFRKKITIATVSNNLATDLEYLLSSLGYSYSRQISPSEERIINGRRARFSRSHTIEFYPLQMRSPINNYPLEMGGIGCIKESKLKWAMRKRNQRSISYKTIQSLKENQIEINRDTLKFINSDLGVLPVVSLEKRNPLENEYVYDYSVDGDENFVGGNGAICLHNSLDACEEAGILPEIFVQVEELGKDHYRLTIKDNGPGIPKTHIGRALGQMLAGTKFHRYIQQRGQQGIGAAACSMFSFLTTGRPTTAITCHENIKLTATVTLDFKKNKPVIQTISTEPTEEHGLTVISEYKDVRYERSNHGIYEYLRRTALANPHCSIELIEPNNEKTVFPRSVEQNPRRPFEIKPHPLGIGTHDLLEFAKHNKDNKRISSFLQNSFARVSAGKVEELKSRVPDLDFNRNPDKLTWDDAEKLVKAFSEVKWIAPATDSLVPIGKEQVEASFRNIFNPEVLMITGRSPRVYRGGIPFMVEVGIAYGGGVSQAHKKGEVMRFSNKVPLLFDTGGCAITETIKSMDWKRYNIKNFEEEPIAVLVNLVSVHIPYTSAGKQAISSEEDVMSEIKFALMEASRGIQKYLSRKRKAHEIATKKKVVSRYIKQLSSDLGSLTGKKAEIIEKELVGIIEKKYVRATNKEESENIEETSEETEVNEQKENKKK